MAISERRVMDNDPAPPTQPKFYCPREGRTRRFVEDGDHYRCSVCGRRLDKRRSRRKPQP